MARRDDNLQARLDRDLAELKLPEIAKSYREVLDEAARKGSSTLEVLGYALRHGADGPPAASPRAADCARPGCPSGRRWPSTTSISPSGFPRPRSCGCSTATSSRGMAVRCSLGRPELESRI